MLKTTHFLSLIKFAIFSGQCSVLWYVKEYMEN